MNTIQTALAAFSCFCAVFLTLNSFHHNAPEPALLAAGAWSIFFVLYRFRRK